VIHEKYIYEFDLTKCFNSIRLKGHEIGLDYINRNPDFIEQLSLESILQKLKVPDDVISHLIKFQENTPKLADSLVDKEDPEL
jgi:hypothetical protein